MGHANYFGIINIIMNIVQYDEISNIIFVSGGIVPWLISGNNSNRKHDDLDLLVSKENMPIVRDFLIKHNLYNASLDSLNYEDAEMVDYGVDTYIDNIPVGFYPYEKMIDGSIVQRSFSLAEIDHKKDLKVKKIPNMAITDYLSTATLQNGTIIGISSLEVIRVTKALVGREKDIYDIKEIDRIGYDFYKYERVKHSIDNMTSSLDKRAHER